MLHFGPNPRCPQLFRAWHWNFPRTWIGGVGGGVSLCLTKSIAFSLGTQLPLGSPVGLVCNSDLVSQYLHFLLLSPKRSHQTHNKGLWFLFLWVFLSVGTCAAYQAASKLYPLSHPSGQLGMTSILFSVELEQGFQPVTRVPSVCNLPSSQSVLVDL